MQVPVKLHGFRHLQVAERVVDLLNDLNPGKPVKLDVVSWDPNLEEPTRLPEVGEIWCEFYGSPGRLSHFQSLLKRETEAARLTRGSIQHLTLKVGEVTGPAAAEQVTLDPFDMAAFNFVNGEPRGA